MHRHQQNQPVSTCRRTCRQAKGQREVQTRKTGQKCATNVVGDERGHDLFGNAGRNERGTMAPVVAQQRAQRQPNQELHCGDTGHCGTTGMTNTLSMDLRDLQLLELVLLEIELHEHKDVDHRGEEREESEEPELLK